MAKNSKELYVGPINNSDASSIVFPAAAGLLVIPIHDVVRSILVGIAERGPLARDSLLRGNQSVVLEEVLAIL